MEVIDLSNPLNILMMGCATGLIGIGLQNYNPLEPRACTHSCSIAVGIACILVLILINISKVVYNQWKKKHQK